MGVKNRTLSDYLCSGWINLYVLMYTVLYNKVAYILSNRFVCISQCNKIISWIPIFINLLKSDLIWTRLPIDLQSLRAPFVRPIHKAMFCLWFNRLLVFPEVYELRRIKDIRRRNKEKDDSVFISLILSRSLCGRFGLVCTLDLKLRKKLCHLWTSKTKTSKERFPSDFIV